MKRNPARLLVEPSDYVLRNIGDMAMLQVATKRLTSLLPDSLLQVLTCEPLQLREFCPHAQPLEAEGRDLWLALVPARLSRRISVGLATKLRLNFRQALLPLLQLRRGSKTSAAAKIEAFLTIVKNADAFIVTGMGGITDFFPDYARDLLDSIALALHFNVPVVLLGQGIGPLENRWLRARAAAVLPRVELIAVREQRASVPILSELGVHPDRIAVTGDDALQLGYELRQSKAENGIGFNLRMADYSGIAHEDGKRAAKVVCEQAQLRSAPIIALPVSQVRGEADAGSLCAVMPGLANQFRRESEIAKPADLIRETLRCRIVIVGSYHAAVFALSAGIPAIGLARSSYYVDKFAGLSDMFGAGCELVNMNDVDASSSLAECIGRLWDGADCLRDELLHATERQIASGQAVYQKIANMISSSRNDA